MRCESAAPMGRQVGSEALALLEARGCQADPAQRAAIEALGRWLDDWQHGRRGWLRAPAAGVYLWGGVGRGKSLVMDVFHAVAPLEDKRRVHFHSFLAEIQTRLRDAAGQGDPLPRIARQIAEETRLLCFDEFHVHDIGDAMLLGRLLQALVEQGVGLVMTSNYVPSGLCPNPLYRDRFKPAITLLEKRFEVFNLDGGRDYRQDAGQARPWGDYCHLEPGEGEHWLAASLGLSEAAVRDARVEVNHRALHLRAHEGARAWLDFDELCRQPRSSADFLWLCRHFEHLAIGTVPCLDRAPIDVQQRFLNFVDIAYDGGTRLSLLCETELDALLSEGGHVDFSRTRSRLRQLRLVGTPAVSCEVGETL